jgi:Ca-activated chloride channel family protein
LWARRRIANLTLFDYGHESDKQKQEVTSLGLKYNLLTRHTSFIAVYEAVRNTTGSATDVTQPVPLPEGVSNRAIGSGSIAVGAEPPLTLLLALLALFGGAALYIRVRNRRETVPKAA